MQRMSVLLPDPLGPMIATHSPRLTVKSTSTSTCRSPKTLFKPRTSIMWAEAEASDAAGGGCEDSAICAPPPVVADGRQSDPLRCYYVVLRRGLSYHTAEATTAARQCSWPQCTTFCLRE